MATEMNFETNARSTPHPEVNGGQQPGSQALKNILEGVERDLILAALKESHGNKAKAARALGITERFMGLRVKRLGIDWRGLRPSRKTPAGRIA
jgi:transcriptional regulator with GAF, ATPase, and Fis domain